MRNCDIKFVNNVILIRRTHVVLSQTGQMDEAKKTLKALIADVPYSNKKLACMDMEERYRLIISSILNAIGFRVDVERMMANGRIDIIASSNIYM